MLKLLKLLSTSTKPLNYTEIRRANVLLSDLQRAHAEKLVWAGDYLPSTYTITEAGRARLAELEAEERVLEALKDGPLSSTEFFAKFWGFEHRSATVRLEKAGKVVVERDGTDGIHSVRSVRLATPELPEAAVLGLQADMIGDEATAIRTSEAVARICEALASASERAAEVSTSPLEEVRNLLRSEEHTSELQSH